MPSDERLEAYRSRRDLDTSGEPSGGSGHQEPRFVVQRRSSRNGPMPPTGSDGTRIGLKIKCESGQELVVGGYTEPQGSRVGLGALLVGYYDDGGLRYAGKVGTGYDEATLRDLRQRLDELAQASSPFRRHRA